MHKLALLYAWPPLYTVTDAGIFNSNVRSSQMVFFSMENTPTKKKIK